MSNDNPQLVKLRHVRAAFPAFFAPDVDKKSKRKTYGAKFINETAGKFAEENLAAVEAAMMAAAEKKWPGKGAKMLDMLRTQDRLALHDGNTKMDLVGFEGNTFISARNTRKPRVFDNVRDPDTGKPAVLDEDTDKIYSGVYVNADIEFYAQDDPEYGKRINGSLRGVQFARHGERYAGGAISSADDFDEFVEDELDDDAFF